MYIYKTYIKPLIPYTLINNPIIRNLKSIDYRPLFPSYYKKIKFDNRECTVTMITPDPKYLKYFKNLKHPKYPKA